MSTHLQETHRRRTFAIVSHPDAGKTTLTEKLLLFGGAIQMAGSVKGRKAARHATSDWMALEKERGMTVATLYMYHCDAECRPSHVPGVVVSSRTIGIGLREQPALPWVESGGQMNSNLCSYVHR